jgi:FdhD protein
VAVEEPLELRIGGKAVATLMRTPGSDRHLALGFFLTEGWISRLADVGALVLCGRAPVPISRGSIRPAKSHGAHREENEGNIADLLPAAGVSLKAIPKEPRALPVSSSCGVCGKRTIEEVLALGPLGHPENGRILPTAPGRLEKGILPRMPGKLRRKQRLFCATGALHAAGLFNARGNILRVEEDVGRHNAVDKVIGWALLEGLTPLSGYFLQVSGRISFEIVQKAYRAGCPLVAAVSGVSSLAVSFAGKAGITLVGFLRGDSFSVYTHPERLEK